MCAVLGLTACESTKVLQATGGSRADGTVNLSFNYGLFEQPKIDWGAALETARTSCKAWGYSDAQKFGGGLQHCEAMNGYGQCMAWAVTVTYQCTGHPS
ncbi:MAG: hypothetical protein JO261_14135 [Alphaproteobacteria bacterium]|nr:hypothetical protein [Alphaproteobacteria bacterium]